MGQKISLPSILRLVEEWIATFTLQGEETYAMLPLFAQNGWRIAGDGYCLIRLAEHHQYCSEGPWQ